MKSVKILTVLMLTMFSLANAQVHHKKHVVKKRHVIVHRHR
jgi:hypothetical protein